MASAKTHVFNSSQHLTCQSIHESKHEQIRNHQHHVHCQKKEKQKQRLGSLIETLGVAFPHLAADLGLTLQMSDLEPTPGGV